MIEEMPGRPPPPKNSRFTVRSGEKNLPKPRLGEAGSVVALERGADAPWEETGRLIARFHRAGLDHADLNAHNILFDVTGQGWMIDFDRCRLRIPDTAWRERNLARLKRSLLKLRGAREPAVVKDDFARLRGAYDATWQRGY